MLSQAECERPVTEDRDQGIETGIRDQGSGGLTAEVSAQTPSIYTQVESANGHANHGYGPAGKVGIDDRVQIVQQEAALVGGQSGFGLKIRLRKGQRAGPGAGFHGDAPEQRRHVETAPHGPPASPERAKDHQHDPGQMDEQNKDGGRSHGARNRNPSSSVYINTVHLRTG